MGREFLASAIGKPTNAKRVRGRENVPKGDDFSWWTCVYIYINRKTKKEYTLEQLQCKYEMGFAQQELWKIIEAEYDTVEDYIMNVNHPRRKQSYRKRVNG